MALIGAQVDYAVQSLQDIRVFNTLVMTPDWEKIQCEPAAIVALDGFLTDGERSQVLRRFPMARVIEVDDLCSQNAEMVKRLLPADEKLRDVFRTLRKYEKAEYSLSLFAAQTDLSEESVLCALRIFEQLNLLSFNINPLSYRLLPSGKVSLESSSLRQEMIRLSQFKN